MLRSNELPHSEKRIMISIESVNIDTKEFEKIEKVSFTNDLTDAKEIFATFLNERGYEPDETMFIPLYAN